MMASTRSTQLRLLLWKVRQSEMNRIMISSRRMNVTIVSVLPGLQVSDIS